MGSSEMQLYRHTDTAPDKDTDTITNTDTQTYKTHNCDTENCCDSVIRQRTCDKMSEGNESVLPPPNTEEAMWGMTIIMIILVMVAIFFCIMPVIRLIKKRMSYWDQIENDPRWNIDHFQFSPTHTATQGDTRIHRLPDQIEIKMPPAYSDLFSIDTGDDASLGDPPSYYYATHWPGGNMAELGRNTAEETLEDDRKKEKSQTGKEFT